MLLSFWFLLEDSIFVLFNVFFKLVLFPFCSGLIRAGQDRSTYEPIDQQDASPQWPDPSKAAPHPY